MARELRRISYDEFAANAASVLDRVIEQHEPVVVEKPNDARVVLRPLASRKFARRRHTVSEADYAAFLSSAGGWKGLVDTEKLKADNAHSRSISSRPPVKL